MRQWHAGEQEEKLLFARKAAEHFAEHPESVTFTMEGPKEGAYMALRWGMMHDCVAVVKLCEYTEPLNYVEFIDRDKAKLTGLYHEAGLAAVKAKQQEKKDA